jgi:hypothetical protein
LLNRPPVSRACPGENHFTPIVEGTVEAFHAWHELWDREGGCNAST